MTTTGPAPIGVIAQYNLLERLEPSGPGDLFRARDTHHGRTVAIRLLPADLTPGTSDREGITVVLVTHEPDIAAAARRVITVRDGRIQSDELTRPVTYSVPAAEAGE